MHVLIAKMLPTYVCSALEIFLRAYSRAICLHEVAGALKWRSIKIRKPADYYDLKTQFRYARETTWVAAGRLAGVFASPEFGQLRRHTGVAHSLLAIKFF